MMKWLYDVFKDLRAGRYPIKVQIFSTGVDRPTVAVRVTNRNPSGDVVVHAVRVHYGNQIFSRSFILSPGDKVSIRAKDRSEWLLSFDEVRLTERTRQRTPPLDIDLKKQPGIESPAQLFNAIGMGEKSHSWIEVDFNEYSQRQFLKGKVKFTFDLVGKRHRELRKQKKSEQDDALSA
jgi:hypothetical protein